ncbi:MAG: FAD/NAD(P)-binding protein [Actinomycetota bacterium]|nr:FAD/NAD(P)-binding protein [Actinomycetota bacterium]
MTSPLRLIVVGGGPRAAGLLERMGASAPELLDRPLVVHIVDPFPAGAGRVWRHDQSPLLRMNSMAEDVTMFTDETVVCEGPVRAGPSLFEWSRRVSAADLPADVLDELALLRSTTFPSRRLQSAYLEWFLDDVIESLPDNMSVVVHPTRVSGISGRLVLLDGVAEPLVADVVVLALGHLDAETEPEHLALAEYASDNGLFYLPPAYSADVDLSDVDPGADVVLRGFGLAFIDLMVLLTEGRGGRFEETPAGLRYLPSGREPRIHVGSRRGVPYHSKTGYRLQGDPPLLPMFFGADVVDELISRGVLDFRTDVWPVLAKEIAWGHYRELFTGHPSRVLSPWPDFADEFTRLEWYSAEMAELIDRTVPAPEDRIDFEALDRPFAGRRFASSDDLQEALRDYIASDIARRSDPTHSADLGAFMALLSVFGQLPRLLASPAMAPRSRREDGDGWWFGYFNYLASGPPPDRLDELLALSRAGVVRFLGADMWVRAEDGVFLAGGASTPEVVRATGLIEARLPTHSLSRTADPVLRGLAESGEATEENLADGIPTGLVVVSPDDGRLIGVDGKAHAHWFALGPFTTGRAFAAFSRPRTNAPAFQQNDRVARAVLRTLAAVAQAGDVH